MSYYIGIDGGGTKTDCVIADENLNVIHKCSGGAANFLLLGNEAVCGTILKLIDECLASAKLGYGDITGIVMGASGAGRRSDAEKLEKAFFEYCAPVFAEIKNFHVESDARIALEGAFSCMPGAILISGTGSIIFGKDSEGNIHRAGGFGRLVGDEGSGYSIGKKGLAAAAKAFDGRAEETIITLLLKEDYKIDSPDSLVTEIYRNSFDIASAAQLVLKGAEKNDAACNKIIEEETEELILHILAMAKKLKVPLMQLSLMGGMLNYDNAFSRTLLFKIKEITADIAIKKPEHTPMLGAVLLAKKLFPGK